MARGGRAGGRGAGGRGGGRGSLPPGVTLPISQPQGGFRRGDWNQVEIILDANILRPFLNDGASAGLAAVADEQFGRYGPIGLQRRRDG